MRFRFRNIGPIDNAELELGDLTLIAGRNNTGKTYIVYTLYGFLRNWRNLVTRRFSPRQRQMLLVAGRRLREGLAKHPEAPASNSSR